jgi:hypothetical protein
LQTSTFPSKPLGHKSYGTIAHLPGSRQGRDDVGINPGHGRICMEKARDKHDRIIVLEKLDGTNVSVANIDGAIIPLIRAGYPAVSSKWEHHRLFAAWAHERLDLFSWLKPGERLCGEWLAQAHGTRYVLTHEPFVAFDIMRNRHERAPWSEVAERCITLPTAHVLHEGDPLSIPDALALLGEHGHHGAIDPVEGAVWRVERMGVVDLLAKYVRHEKVDGKYLPEISGGEPVWNWRPH